MSYDLQPLTAIISLLCNLERCMSPSATEELTYAALHSPEYKTHGNFTMTRSDQMLAIMLTCFRMVCIGGYLLPKIIWPNPPATAPAICHYIRLLKAPCHLALKTTYDRLSTNSLTNVF